MMLKSCLALLVVVTACLAIPVEQTPPAPTLAPAPVLSNEPVPPPPPPSQQTPEGSDLNTDNSFWWGYQPYYRSYHVRPRYYTYYSYPYYSSHWGSHYYCHQLEIVK